MQTIFGCVFSPILFVCLCVCFMFDSTTLKLKCKNTDTQQTSEISKSSESNNTKNFPVSESNFSFCSLRNILAITPHHCCCYRWSTQPHLRQFWSLQPPVADVFKAEEVLITSILLRFLFAAQISLLCAFSINKLRADWGRAALNSNSFASICF